MEHESAPAQRLTSALARLDKAVDALEHAVEAQIAANVGDAEELASTRAELAELRGLHATVCGRLDATIARLRAVVEHEEGGGPDPSEEAAAVEGR